MISVSEISDCLYTANQNGLSGRVGYRHHPCASVESAANSQ